MTSYSTIFGFERHLWYFGVCRWHATCCDVIRSWNYVVMILWIISRKTNIKPSKFLKYDYYTCLTYVSNGSFWGIRDIDFAKFRIKSCSTRLRVQEVDFGSMFPIVNNKPKSFCTFQIFGHEGRLLVIIEMIFTMVPPPSPTVSCGPGKLSECPWDS